MTDLVDFLLTRIAEDKAAAEAAMPGPTNEERANADHIARWDPARGLADCEAKRLIVTLHPLADGYCEGCGIGTQIPDGCLNLRALALPYADHPDFRPEWKPT